MFHDQGLPVIKTTGFGKSVNITLGLPFLRISVDHGTANELAGKNLADNSSFDEALRIKMKTFRTHLHSQVRTKNSKLSSLGINNYLKSD